MFPWRIWKIFGAHERAAASKNSLAGTVKSIFDPPLGEVAAVRETSDPVVTVLKRLTSEAEIAVREYCKFPSDKELKGVVSMSEN